MDEVILQHLKTKHFPQYFSLLRIPFKSHFFKLSENGLVFGTMSYLHKPERQQIQNGTEIIGLQYLLRGDFRIYTKRYLNYKIVFIYERGRLISKTLYRDGILIKMEAYDPVEGWYEEDLSSEELLHDHIYRYHDGKIRMRIHFVNGDRLRKIRTHYYHNGNLQRIEHLSGSVRDGSFESWSEDGHLEEKGQYVRDQKEGIWEQYYLSQGEYTLYRGPYQNGKRNGLWTTESNGVKTAEGNYVDDNREGFWTFWNQKGEKISSGNYHQDEREGIWSYWHNGKLVRTE